MILGIFTDRLLQQSYSLGLTHTFLNKTLRGSDERGGKQGMIHRVSAWASQNRLVLGQRKVNEKSNEITAILELLKVLDLNGAVVNVEAMGCQTEIAAQIVE